jgi:hypothetical protein
VLAARTGLVPRLPLICQPPTRVTASIKQAIAATARAVGMQAPTAAAVEEALARFVRETDCGLGTRVGHPSIY